MQERLIRIGAYGEYYRGNRKDNRPFSRNRASIGAVRTLVVSDDRGPRSLNFVATEMGNSAIGAVRRVCAGPIIPLKQTSVHFCAKGWFGLRPQPVDATHALNRPVEVQSILDFRDLTAHSIIPSGRRSAAYRRLRRSGAVESVFD
jgi:hypothetical protein